ncbi:MAG: DegV family protein [Bacillales bacterium]|jgi:DegV family protein with EDD domain|nr:DegV family protein [Bacillales bacterium]
MAKIKIVSDTDAGINQKLADELGIFIFHKPLACGTKEVIDTVTLTYDEFLNEIKAGNLYKSSQMATTYIEETFTEILKDYDYIIYIPISSKMSTAYENGVNIANQFNGRVRCLDIREVAQLEGYEVLLAQRLIDEGHEFNEICETLLKRAGKSQAFIIPSSLKWLKAGGRITPGAATMANLLGIKPILQLLDGAICKYGVGKSLKQCYKKAIQATIDIGIKPETHELLLLHTNEPKLRDEFLQIIKEFPELDGFKIKDDLVPGVVLVHLGPGAIALVAIPKI